MSNGLSSLQLSPVDLSQKIKLGSKAASIEGPIDKTALQAATSTLLARLNELQEMFHADGRHALLLVLQGRDASGKDGVIRTVYGAFNPIGVHVAAFGPPTPLELRHDFLWRVHQLVPPRGMVGVFNRSHYEDVLAVRVRELAPENVWRARFDHINTFERMLTDSGVIIRKCMLHVSREAQHERLQARLDDPTKNWKFRLDDLKDRDRWDAYTDAYREVLERCSTPSAPWYVVPSDDKTVRNYLIAQMLVDTLESTKSTFPPMDEAVRTAAAGFD
ncbi:PPK2 family polyphosphate kinase [Gemmatimonas sp.]|uniref:PPK2 family polyphosphate kinase n=1 Tax=Gemmatimonas sp. TaxID=1962908 RepID=UPI0035671805